MTAFPILKTPFASYFIYFHISCLVYIFSYIFIQFICFHIFHIFFHPFSNIFYMVLELKQFPVLAMKTQEDNLQQLKGFLFWTFRLNHITSTTSISRSFDFFAFDNPKIVSRSQSQKLTTWFSLRLQSPTTQFYYRGKSYLFK